MVSWGMVTEAGGGNAVPYVLALAQCYASWQQTVTLKFLFFFL